jgi:small subunit ribosomal protein S4
VRHGHVTVNGKRVDIPSVQLRAGDEVGLREKSRNLTAVTASLESRKGQPVPEWLELNTTAMSGRVLNIPSRQSIQVPINEQLIVELYSK